MNRFDFRWAVLPVLGTVMGGCGGEEFDPFGRVNSLRVLAIQSEPVSPGAGESTTLTPLLYVPRSHTEPTFRWSWCLLPGPASEGYSCEVDAESLGEWAGMVELPPADLGTGETAVFENTVDPAILAMFCSRTSEVAGILDCEHGFPVQVKLTVTTDKDEVVAVRTLNLRFDETASANTNPVFEGLEVKLGGEWQSVDDDFEGLVPRDKAVKLRTNVSEDQSERYQTTDEDGQVEDAWERLSMAWFVETGITESERTGYIRGKVPINVLEENEWVPEPREDYSRDSSEVILVLRDNREGVSWQRFSADLTEEP